MEQRQDLESQNTKGHVIQTRTFKSWLRGDGIIESRSFPLSEQKLADAVENVQALVTLSAGKRRPCLVDYRGIKSIDREARAYYAGTEICSVQTAAALVIDNYLERVIGNFFMGINKPRQPTRLFNNEADAIEWLKNYRDDE